MEMGKRLRGASTLKDMSRGWWLAGMNEKQVSPTPDSRCFVCVLFQGKLWLETEIICGNTFFNTCSQWEL